MFKTIEKKEDIPNLKQAQEFIGGWVERLKLPSGDVLLFDEEGIRKELPINNEATKLVNSFEVRYPITILGNVIYLPKSLRQRKW